MTSKIKEIVLGLAIVIGIMGGIFIIGNAQYDDSRPSAKSTKGSPVNDETWNIKTVHGTITKVEYTENVMENGHYSLTIKNSEAEKTYLIEATGYMNIPMAPAERGERCLDELSFNKRIYEEGDRVAFHLPEFDKNTISARPNPFDQYDKVFLSCYPLKDAGEYYFVKVGK